jgi:hypothetical protein
MICFVSPEEKDLLFFFYIEHPSQSIAAQGFQNRFGKQNPDFCQELIFRYFLDSIFKVQIFNQ